MGLDIIYYSDLKFVKEDSPENAENDDDSLSFLYKIDGVADRTDGLAPGWYQTTEGGSFRAGSYSGYNAWRNELARCMLGVSDEQVWKMASERKTFNKKPFVELINYSDCEGFIGPKTAAKLAQDFSKFENKAKAHQMPNDPDNWFYTQYQKWKTAFEVASNNGAVKFC